MHLRSRACGTAEACRGVGDVILCRPARGCGRPRPAGRPVLYSTAITARRQAAAKGFSRLPEGHHQLNELVGTLPTFIGPEAVVYQVNEVLRGSANYFCYGTYTPAFHVVHRHACRRLRRWLRRKLELGGQGVSQYPDSRLVHAFGLLNLDRFPRRHSWAKS